MSLPALTATGATLRVAPAQVGLTMSLFMLGFGRRSNASRGMW
jgi:DHA1 family bicyclomycin/chloramphenicol resistance-like MFS transporter